MARRTGSALPLADLTEKEWDTQLFATKTGLATTLGWTMTYHTLRSKGSASGFPDRVLVRDRVVFVETKTEKGRASDSQRAWLTALATADAEVYLWRPSDLDEIARILAARTRVAGMNSAWTADGCRYDEHLQKELAA